MVFPQQNSVAPALRAEIEAIYRLYASLAQSMDREAGLGGKLLYAGEPDEPGCRLLRAANIAGAASLAASADASCLRAAMRAGALDFVVTSLDEALRILKNEIRKRQPVAAGVSLAAEVLLGEMAERGVQPDLQAPVEPAPASGRVLHLFPIPPEWRQPAGAFETLLLDCLAPDDANRRWVRLAPRYLPAAARRVRSVACHEAEAQALLARIGKETSASTAR